MTKHFVRLAGPSIITNIFSYMVMTVNTIFAGQFKEESAAKLAGVGLGSMILGMFCRHVLAGINCAQETLVSQAYGNGQLKLSGIYYNRGFFIMSLVYVPLAVLLSFSFPFLIAIGQNEAVATYATEYIFPMIPAMYFLGLFDLSRRYLTCLQYS
jgi:MATE family multidrug resistance protein